MLSRRLPAPVAAPLPPADAAAPRLCRPPPLPVAAAPGGDPFPALAWVLVLITASVAALVALTSWPASYFPSGGTGDRPLPLLPMACATLACLALVLLVVSGVRRTRLPVFATDGPAPKL